MHEAGARARALPHALRVQVEKRSSAQRPAPEPEPPSPAHTEMAAALSAAAGRPGARAMAAGTCAPCEPTAEMVSFFEARTSAHIATVVRHAELMAGFAGLSLTALRARAAEHDDSKWREPERAGYIWHSWCHRCRILKRPFAMLPAAERAAAAATKHHMAHNRHHTESHARADDMSELDIVEMVADLTAISRENGASSCKQWVAANAHRFAFDNGGGKQAFFHAAIAELDRRLAAAGLQAPGSTFCFDLSAPQPSPPPAAECATAAPTGTTPTPSSSRTPKRRPSTLCEAAESAVLRAGASDGHVGDENGRSSPSAAHWALLRSVAPVMVRPLEDAVRAELARVRRQEPRVTRIMEGVCSAVEGARLHGIEFRLKTAESLKRKVTVKLAKMAAASEGGPSGPTVEDCVALVHTQVDLLRYTIVMRSESYTVPPSPEHAPAIGFNTRLGRREFVAALARRVNTQHCSTHGFRHV